MASSSAQLPDRNRLVSRNGRFCKSMVLCRPPVSMTFNVPMFSASPLKVLYLKIQERSNYNVEKWVRKVCKAGSYDCRTK